MQTLVAIATLVGSFFLAMVELVVVPFLVVLAATLLVGSFFEWFERRA